MERVSKRRKKIWGVKLNGSAELSTDTDTKWESSTCFTTRFEISSLLSHSSLQRCPSSCLYLIPLPLQLSLLSTVIPVPSVAVCWYYYYTLNILPIHSFLSASAFIFYFFSYFFPLNLTLCYIELAGVFVLCQDQLTPNFSSYCRSDLASETFSARQHDGHNPAYRGTTEIKR